MASRRRQAAVDRVEMALAAVEPRTFMLQPNGAQLPQTTRPEIIVAMLRLLDVDEGDAVLEIGTGSGLSTALLSFLVGAGGRVTTIDVDREVVDRARPLFQRAGLRNVALHLGDGYYGFPDEAPYDSLVAWASLEQDVPAAWVEQVSVGGVIVAPVRQPEKRALKLRVRGLREIVREGEIPAGFIPLTPNAYHPWEHEQSPPRIY